MGDYDRTARVDRQGNTRFAKDEQAVRMHRALHPGHQPRPNQRPPAHPKRQQVEAPTRRGMTRNTHVDNHMRNDDLMLNTMMAHTIINTPSPTRSYDADTCRAPSGGYDTSPSDSGGSFDGGGSCD
ncbi:hypothetical protein HOT49_gp053 [Erwinia phage vB_EamM_Alexandra]|uniref:Uncharacterized protein n=1 Tax=Erwinia phage vB_EamM_Alexandra TaxID=2201424 RepID=A0A2Z4QE24_9CAUD|nr:hypothetical protein HOT49_gp053 [Erwinia phage vB_EamM_Alexandra]AWY08333.1 hypothetical protein Alexandra_53 [Erwinia phage vB_EamM_Alexandra]